MLRIGVKYCGGCSAQFDRVALVENISKHLSGKAVFVSHTEEDVDLILVVAGCQSACVDLSPFKKKEVFIIHHERHSEAFICKILREK